MRKTLTIAGTMLSSLHGAMQDQSSTVVDANVLAMSERDSGYAVTLSAPLNVNMENMYAGHRSHSSHSSHRSHSSHSSHYSGSGSSYSPPPAPRSTYVPPPPSPPAPKRTYTPPSTYQPTTPAPSTYRPATPTAPSDAKKPWRNYGSQQLLESETSSRPSADQLRLMIMRVQAALYSKGYDPGAIDGVLGGATKTALRSFQADHGLIASGAMTTETLNALGISLRP